MGLPEFMHQEVASKGGAGVVVVTAIVCEEVMGIRVVGRGVVGGRVGRGVVGGGIVGTYFYKRN